MSTKIFSSTKFKVITAFSLLAIGLITAIYFSVSSFKQISASVETLAKPNAKSAKLNQLLTDVSEAESQIRAYTLTQEQPYLINYETSLNRVFNKIDTLRLLTSRQPGQRKRIDSIAMLMQQKIKGLNQFMELKAMTDQQSFSDKALSRLSKRSGTSVKVKTALKTTQKKVEETVSTLPRVSIEPVEKKGFFSRIFGSKEKPNIMIAGGDSTVTTTRTEVSIDTIALNLQAPDTVLGNVRKILKELQEEEHSYRRQLTSQELELLEKDQAIMDQIRQMIRELEREEAQLSAANAREATRVANQASFIIFMISCAGLLSSLVFMILIVKDITRSNYYKKSLELARQRSERLRHIKEQFLANMSHEIRTPLNAIIGFTEQLRKARLPEPQQSQIKAISSSSEFLLAIVTDILDLSKIEAGQLRFEKKDFELRNLIEETCYVVENKAQVKDILLQKDFPEGPFYLQGDSFRLQQILFNLLSNAIKFTEEGSVRIRFDANDNGFSKYVVTIEVQDTGIGISPEHLPYIFENFSQADDTITRKYGGTGLGLAITKKLVELQGGQISVESEKGKGSLFKVSIPFAKGQEHVATEPADIAIVQEEGWSGKKVLLVEDDTFNAMLLRTILRKWGIDSDEASSGFQALEKIKQRTYDLVLTDINMPGMSGMQLLKELRQLPDGRSDTPVVAVTANAMPHDLNNYLKQGMDAYLLKPYSEKDLGHLLASIWENNKVEQEAPEEEQAIEQQEEESLSLEVFNQFASGDPQAFLLLLQSFLENTSDNIRQLKQLQQAKDYVNLSELAHKMYPTFKHLRAERAAAILKQMELTNQKEAENEFDQLIEELQQKIEEVVDFVEEKVRQLSKSEVVNP
ncbi:ATP-binding protein [Nafulsella turpanensis]|uniref:ATP-binding protein n=1 Tax=Nafulsella turpanensis TaxID=1265690 RepID=UPI00036BFAC9|nr:ATP-binding protein [Nafulsella turpanensis]